MFYRVSNGGTEFKARFTITGTVELRGGGNNMNYVYGGPYGQLQFTDNEDLHIASYNIISGNVNVTHTENVWTFTNAQVGISYLDRGSSVYYSSTSVVEITFER